MYLVGDRISIPSPSGGNVLGTVSMIEEQPAGELAYIINTDDNQIVVRYSDSDDEIVFVDNITLDFN